MAVFRKVFWRFFLFQFHFIFIFIYSAFSPVIIHQNERLFCFLLETKHFLFFFFFSPIIAMEIVLQLLKFLYYYSHLFIYFFLLLGFSCINKKLLLMGVEYCELTITALRLKSIKFFTSAASSRKSMMPSFRFTSISLSLKR